MLRLYHNDMSTCAQKVRIALAEKHLASESVHLKLRDGDQFDLDYLKLNPKGVVPTLIHDDLVIRESQVILEYLSVRSPSAPVCKTGMNASEPARAIRKPSPSGKIQLILKSIGPKPRQNGLG